MRSICNIDFKNNVAWGSSASAQSINEILLSIYPTENMKSNLRIEITDTKGKVITESVERERNGLINHTLSSLYYLTAGTFKLRLLSDEENSSYVLYKTLENLTDGDDIVCKYRFATQTFEVYKIVIESSAGSDYDDKPLWDAVEEIRVKYLTVDAFNAEKATIYDLIAEKANITDLTAINAEIENLKANKADIGELNAEIAKVNELIAKKANIDDLHAIEATIEQLNVHIANIDKAIIDVAHISDLEAINAKIESIEAGNINTDALEAHFARIDLANIKDGCITNAMIGEGVIESAQIADGSITDAKIVTLTANKLTAGRIDASDIEVVNLNCANLTVGTINGKQITNGAIDWDKLASQVGNTINNADENASQALEDALKAYQEAQKASSAAGTAQSTANGKNTVIYASSQPSTSGRKTNDVWFDTDDSYKMYYFNGTAWVAAQFGTNAIKNASITTALIADAAINNAKIANIDAGKITSGYISSDRIAANSITIGKLDSATQDSINGAARKIYHETVGTSGASGYFLLAEIKIKQVYSNRPIKISIANRGTMSSDVYILFNNANSIDPNIQYFSKNGGAKFYIHKAAASTWNLYVLKSESYDSLAVVDFDGSSYASKISVTWKSTQVSTLPSGYTEAKQLAGMADWCYANNITNIDGSKIYTGTVDAVQIKANAIIAGKIAANAVTTANLQADCVNADKIAAKAINAEHINGAIITSDKIVAGAITGDKIAARTIDATKIVANTITAAEIKAGTITGDKIAAGTIDASKIKAGTITAIQIAANAITAEKIAANAVTAAKIATDAIKSRNYVANSVGSFLNLADGTFTSKNLKWTSDGSLTGSNVNLTGTITAKYGKIGKFNINDYYLMAGSGSNAAGMSGDQAFWAGGELSNVAPFRVSYDGKLVATNATITGKISGSTISGGTISGVSITGGSITSGTSINVTTDLKVGNNIYVGSYNDRNTQKNIYLNDKFYIYSRNNMLALGVYNGDYFEGKLYINAAGECNVKGPKINVIGGNNITLSSGYNVVMVNGKGGEASFWSDDGAYGGYFTPRQPQDATKICLGTTSYYWHRVYASTPEWTPSDIRKKTNIKTYDERFEKMYMELKPITYEFINNRGKSHCGLIAQWTKNAMDKHGINDTEFGAYEYSADSDSYGIVYPELTSLNMYMIQKTIKRVDVHDDEIARLKDKITELQSKLNAYILGEMEVRRA